MELKLHSEKLTKNLFALDNENLTFTQKTDTSIILCRSLLSYFQKIIHNSSFIKVSYEIEFFKETKQVPLHHLIYFSEIRSLEMHYPRLNRRKQENYLRQRMNKINRFYLHNIDFIQYVESGKTHLDEQYFTRKYFDENIITHTKFYFLNPEFNTSHDLLLAKFSAYQKLINYLYAKLNELEDSDNLVNAKMTSKKKLHWTSTKVALTELVYALNYSGAINNGTADIKEIATVFQKVFNFELGDYYRTYLEIRSRKKSKAKFLEELSYSFSNRLESDDE
tara:strand:+ start:1490 stop:2326 length:837 start_codon:yes stop_codon:yes gene_type:complete